MFNKELFDKICSVTVSEEELFDFAEHLSEAEFDLEAPFKKYYSLSSIEKCIDLYKSGRVDDKYMSYWACAYNWIIMGGAGGDGGEAAAKPGCLKKIIRDDISNWLDSLSFYEKETHESVDYFGPDAPRAADVYLETFRVLNSIYTAPTDWCAFYILLDDDDSEKANLLLVSKRERKFLTLYSNRRFDFQKHVEKDNLCDEYEFWDRVSFLKQISFEEIKIGFSPREEESDLDIDEE